MLQVILYGAMHLYNQSLLSINYVPNTILGPRDTVHKIKAPCSQIKF